MTRDIIIATLKAREPEQRRLGMRHTVLFGSASRGEAAEASDIDIPVDLQPNAPIGVFEYVRLTQFVANHAGLKPYVRPSADPEAVDAF